MLYLDDDVVDFRLECRCLAGMKASELSVFASEAESPAFDVVEELRRFLAAAGLSLTIDGSTAHSPLASFAGRVSWQSRGLDGQ